MSEILTTDPYHIPGGELCTVCGLRFYQRSYGGPGICSACDCGFTGSVLVEAQRKEIERLEDCIKGLSVWSMRAASEVTTFRRAAERMFNTLCFSDPEWVAENEDVCGPLREALK